MTSNMKITIGTNVDTGEHVVLDLDYVIEERMEILGGSGSGKSHLLRCICEQTNGKVQQIIISPKKEYVTLREKFDYVHVGTGTGNSKPEIELNTRYAGQLALKILETGMDAIIEFSENSKDRVKYVKNFIEGLLDAPEHLWHPTMIVIDEIDIWAPEKGHGEAESLGTIADLASRGRDKGFFLVAATQRISKFNKDVAAELGVKFIGKATLDNDQTRAAMELGIPSKEKTKLRDLGRPNFHFYAFGPGLSDNVIKIKSLPVQTTHVSGYKRNKSQKPIPTPAKIKSIISQFSDLPKEAEKEIKTKEELHKKITELQTKLKQSEKIQTVQDPQAIQKAQEIGYQKGFREASIKSKQVYETQIKTLQSNLRSFKPIMRRASSIGAELVKFEECIPGIDELLSENLKLPELPKETQLPIRTDNQYAKSFSITDKTPKVITNGTQSISSLQIDSNEIKLGRCEEFCLKALAQRGKKSSKLQIAVIAGYSSTSGGFNNAISKLKSMELIVVDNGDINITQNGLNYLGSYDPISDDPESLLKFWMDKLGKCPASILEFLCKNKDSFHDKTNIAESTNYSVGSGGFNNGLSKLSSLGLVERGNGGTFRVSEEMFP